MKGYEALRRGVAWSDLSARGRFRATGEDRVRLLHAIATNAIEGLRPGQGAYTFFLDAQGRIRSDSNVFVAKDHALIDCEPSAGPALHEHIERYIIMDDVAVEDISNKLALLAIAGPGADEVAGGLGATLPRDPLSFAEAGELTVYRAPLGGVDGYWVSAPAGEKQRLVSEIESMGAVAASEQDCEAHRVRKGIPRFGVDFSESNIPHETQQLQAVSFSKGCYTGQEIVERVQSQGQVRRLLVGLELESEHLPDGRDVLHEGKPVGVLTSPTRGLPPDGKARGFAVVRREAAVPGTVALIGETAATVLDVGRA